LAKKKKKTHGKVFLRERPWVCLHKQPSSAKPVSRTGHHLHRQSNNSSQGWFLNGLSKTEAIASDWSLQRNLDNDFRSQV